MDTNNARGDSTAIASRTEARAPLFAYLLLLLSREQLSRVFPGVRPHRLAQVDGHLPLFILQGLVRAVLQQEVDNLDVPAHGGPVQRGVVSDVQRVHLGAVLDEKPHGVEVAVVRGARERRLLHQASLLDVGALADE